MGVRKGERLRQDSRYSERSEVSVHLRNKQRTKMAPPASELKAMTDAFEGIDRLAEGAPRTDGAPNFRRLPGFPLFGTGQTSVEGFEKCLEPVLKKYGDEKHIFWVNFNLEVNNPEECTAMENDFAEEIKKRGEDFK